MVLPLADELDRQKAEMPRALIDAMAEKGWFGITIPSEQGGLGLGVFEYCLVSEELARAWLSVGSILARGQGLGTQTLDPERRADLLRRSARGQWIGSISLSEPNAGSDLAGVQTRAVRDGDHWVLTGTKRWAGFAKGADFIEVLARTRDPEPGESRSAGLEPFLVVKERDSFPPGHDRPGDRQDRLSRLPDLRARPSTACACPRATGSPGSTATRAPTRIPAASPRSSAASTSPGSTRRPAPSASRAAAVEDSQAYLQERVQFGHPIGDFQALRFALADMAAEVAQARAFWHQVAHLLDQGEPAESESAMVKLLATEMAVRVTNQAMQLHGGNGYTTERRVERYWRDARLTTIFEGTSEIQRRIISDRMLPRPTA